MALGQILVARAGLLIDLNLLPPERFKLATWESERHGERPCGAPDSPPSLAALAARLNRPFHVGFAAAHGPLTEEGGNNKYSALAAREFNQLTPENAAK